MNAGVKEALEMYSKKIEKEILKQEMSKAAKDPFFMEDLIKISSPGTALKDRFVKSEVYARFGVKEYWLVDIYHRTLEQYLLEEGASTYRFHRAFVEEEGYTIGFPSNASRLAKSSSPTGLTWTDLMYEFPFVEKKSWFFVSVSSPAKTIGFTSSTS